MNWLDKPNVIQFFWWMRHIRVYESSPSRLIFIYILFNFQVLPARLRLFFVALKEIEREAEKQRNRETVREVLERGGWAQLTCMWLSSISTKHHQSSDVICQLIYNTYNHLIPPRSVFKWKMCVYYLGAQSDAEISCQYWFVGIIKSRNIAAKCHNVVRWLCGSQSLIYLM